MAKETVVGNLKDIVNKWYYTNEELDKHIKDKAPQNHVHDYYDKSEVDSKIADKADTVHTHTSRQVVDLRFVLQEKAEVGHTHPESYTKTEVDEKTNQMKSAIENIEGFRTIVLSSLDDKGQEGVLYLYQDGSKTDEHNSYDEYIWTEETGFEKIGSTDINLDLSPYVTQVSLTDQLASYSLSDHVHDYYILQTDAESQLNTKADKTVVTPSEDGLMSSDDYNKLFNIEDGANKTIIDRELSTDSNNPVESSPIYAELQALRLNLEEFSPLIENVEEMQETTVTTLTSENNTLTSENNRLQEELDSYKGVTSEQLQQMQKELEELQNKKLQLESDVAELESANNDLTENNKTLQTQLGDITSARDELQSANEELEGQITEMTSDLEEIRDQVANMQVYGLANETDDGMMSSADFVKLQGIAEHANRIIVDDSLDGSSVNPVQNQAIATKVNDLKTRVANLPDSTTSGSELLLLDKLYGMIYSIDSILKWDVCTDTEVCFYMLNGAPANTRISLYKSGGKICQWGESSHPVLYWTNQNHTETKTAYNADGQCFNYGAYSWLASESDFVWKESEYLNNVDSLESYLANSQAYGSSLTKSTLEPLMTYFMKIMVFFKHIFDDVWQGVKINNSSTLTQFTEQKEIIATAIATITEVQSWLKTI